MRKINFRDIFIPTISLFIICVVITAALAVTNYVTKDKIAQNNLASQQESMLVVCPDAVKFNLLNKTEHGLIYSALDSNLTIIGYAVSTTANGYGGQIKVMTGIDISGEIIGIDVYYNDDETPGLGKNTSNESFTSQFKGLLSDDHIVISKDYAGSGQKVDAVTSSTISSRAVISAVNDACTIYKDQITGGEQ